MNWVDKLRKLNKEFIICVGIDPILSNIQKLGTGLQEWCKIIIDSTAEHTDAYKFQLAYSNLLKSNMDGLKRQKKQKSKKATQ